MERFIDPGMFGLSGRTVLKEADNGTIILVKKRKSRIVMKDGEKIKSIMDKLAETGKYREFVLETNAPLCSKTRKMLKESGIRIKELLL